MTALASQIRKNSGFSIVELVVALVLVGLISVVAMNRLQQTDAFNGIVLRNEIISMVGAAQHRSIGRSNVSLMLEPSVNRLKLLIKADGPGMDEELQLAYAPLETIRAQVDVNDQTSCAVAAGSSSLADSAPIVIEFDTLGNLLRGGVEDSPAYPQLITTGMRICLNEDPKMSVCISAAGLAYAGDCVE